MTLKRVIRDRGIKGIVKRYCMRLEQDIITCVVKAKMYM